MKKDKLFDAVQMKWNIQQTLIKDEDGLEVGARNQRAKDRALADPVLGVWFAKLLHEETPPLVLAEGRAVYGRNSTADNTDGRR